MDYIICYLGKVPNVMWSAIIASLLTIFGVWLTNRGNNKRQIHLLNHEKERFLLEQKMALKKEVFLNMASSFANVLDIIPNLSNLDFSQKQLAPPQI